MAQKTTGKRRIYYRKTEFTGAQKLTLQQLVSSALSRHTYVEDRSETIDAQASEIRVISHHMDVNGFLCGHMVSFERGRYQTVISDEPKAKRLSLSAVVPPIEKNVQQQYAPGVLYFAISQNHVVVMQSAAIRTGAFEHHLAWLLRTKSNLLNSKQGFVLKDEPMPATRERIKRSHVKSVSLGRPLMSETSEDAGTVVLGAGATKKFKPDNAFIELIKDFVSDSSRFEKLGLEDGLFDGNLEVWIEIRYPKRQRSKPEGAVKLLDNLGIALRDLDDNHAKLTLNDGSIVTGKDLRISSDLEFEIDRQGLPNDKDIFEQMSAWLQQQIKNGVISPN